MDKESVLKLADLARIKLSSEEAEKLSHEFESILKYVGEVAEVGKLKKLEKLNKDDYPVRNVMREDGEGHASGIYTEAILAEAPARDGDYIKVKKIL